MSIITQELARKIVRKLGATVDERKNRPHDLACVWVEGKLVATFGLRRGSNKEQGHDHVPDALYVSPREAKLLAQCPMSRDEWIQKLREKNLIPST